MDPRHPLTWSEAEVPLAIKLLLTGLALVAALVIPPLAGWHFSHILITRQRNRVMRRFAARIGGSFRTSGVSDPGDEVWRLFPPLGAQPASAMAHVVRLGDTRAFDLSFPRAFLLPRRWQTFVLIPTGIDIGRVGVKPEGSVDRIVDSLAMSDIGFESHAFTRLHRVTGDRRDLVHALFDLEMIEFMLKSGGVRIAVAPGWALFFWESGFTHPASIEVLFERARSFVALIPRHLREDYPAR